MGRRWNVDPLGLSNESSYACFHNNPIKFIDPLGLSPDDPANGTYKNGDQTLIYKDGVAHDENGKQLDKDPTKINHGTLTDMGWDRTNTFENSEPKNANANGVTNEMRGKVAFDGTYFKKDEEQNNFPFYFSNPVVGPAYRFSQFSGGTGATNLVFGPNHPWTEDLRSWGYVNDGLDYFYNEKYKTGPIPADASVTGYRIDWGVGDALFTSDGRNSYRHYVGSASLSIFKSEDAKNLIIVVANTTNNWSYKVHIADYINRTSAYGDSSSPQPSNSTIANIWIWTVPIDASRLK